VVVEVEEYRPAELIAGRSAAQELHADCFAFFVQRGIGDIAATASPSLSLTLNRKLAHTLGMPVVEVATDDPIQAVVGFVRERQISHLIVGCAESVRPMARDSIESRLAVSVRGVGVRVVEAAAPATRPSRPVWINRGTLLPLTLLFALLVVATAAIAYLSWPLTFSVGIAGAALWCWILHGEPSGAPLPEPLNTEPDTDSNQVASRCQTG
jgi:K+-sensing histidine kinase KdpD